MGGIYSMVTEKGRVDGCHYYTKYPKGGGGGDLEYFKIYIFPLFSWPSPPPFMGHGAHNLKVRENSMVVVELQVYSSRPYMVVSII
jgi:hypothetical protein